MPPAGGSVGESAAPAVADEGPLDAYVATLERLRALAQGAEHVVPGHGPVLDAERALAVIAEDLAYLQELRDSGSEAAARWAAHLRPARPARRERGPRAGKPALSRNRRVSSAAAHPSAAAHTAQP